jgi:MFS family permease
MEDIRRAPRLSRNVYVLGLASLLNDIASEMIVPLLPDFLIGVLGGNRWHLGIIEGAADSASSLLKLFSGGWSDRAGRRKGFVVFGYALAGLARPAIGLIATPWQLFTLRVADRVGKGVRTTPRDALIADSTDPSIRGRAFGFHRAMDHVGAAVGPLLTAAALWLWPGALSGVFLATLVPGVAVLAVLTLGLREVPAGPSGEPVRLTLRPFGRDFRLFLVALAVFTLGNSSDLFLLTRAQRELGVTIEASLALWCVFHAVKSGANLLLGRGADRVGPRPLLFLGWFAYAAVYVGFAVAAAAWHAWALFLTYAVFYGLTEPAEKTLAAALAGPQRKGLAFGWLNFATGVATLPANLIFGGLYEWAGAAVAFGWGAALAGVAAIILVGVKAPSSAGGSR